MFESVHTKKILIALSHWVHGKSNTVYWHQMAPIQIRVVVAPSVSWFPRTDSDDSVQTGQLRWLA